MITREMLQRLLGATPATRGLAYARDGRVVQLDDGKAGWLHARVQGGHDGRGRIVGIDGRCDCPMAWNCKHVAGGGYAGLSSALWDGVASDLGLPTSWSTAISSAR